MKQVIVSKFKNYKKTKSNSYPEKRAKGFVYHITPLSPNKWRKRKRGIDHLSSIAIIQQESQEKKREQKSMKRKDNVPESQDELGLTSRENLLTAGRKTRDCFFAAPQTWGCVLVGGSSILTYPTAL